MTDPVREATPSDPVRERFEAWFAAARVAPDLEWCKHGYVSLDTDWCWKAWKASAQPEPAKPSAWRPCINCSVSFNTVTGESKHTHSFGCPNDPGIFRLSAEPAKPSEAECDQCGKTPAPLKYSYHDGGRWHTEPICEACLMEQRPAKPEVPALVEPTIAELQKMIVDLQVQLQWRVYGDPSKGIGLTIAAAPKEPT